VPITAHGLTTMLHAGNRGSRSGHPGLVGLGGASLIAEGASVLMSRSSTVTGKADVWESLLQATGRHGTTSLAKSVATFSWSYSGINTAQMTRQTNPAEYR